MSCALSAQEARWQELDRQTTELHRQGKYAEARAAGAEALAVAEATFGGEHKNVATALNHLAVQDEALGKYAEAEPLLHRALAMDEKLLGPEHPDVATTLNNQAVLYHAQGNYTAAEPLLQRALAIDEKALGPQHPDVATTLNNLADLYGDEGKFPEIEPLLRRAMAIDEKAFGPEHPDIAIALNCLADLYRVQGKYAQAEPLYRRSLAIREKSLGPNHPDVATTLNTLAALYEDQGKYAEAEPLYRRSLTINEKARGADGPEISVGLNNLAGLYKKQGKYAEAEPLYRRGLEIDEKTLAPGHPDLAIPLSNLAGLYVEQGKYAEAEPLYRRSLAILEKTLGPEHPNVAILLDNLARVDFEQGKYAEAEPLYRRTLAIDEKVLGPDHPDVANALNNLGQLYGAQGRYAEAEPLYRRSLAIATQTLGPDHPKVAISLNNLALIYSDQGRYAEAEPLYRRSLAIFDKALGPDHPHVITPLSNIAMLYFAQGKRVQAEPFFDRELATLDRQFAYHFSYMSEKERLQFLATVSDLFPNYFSFVVANQAKEPTLAGKMLDVVLWEKGFIGQSIAALRAKVAASGDPEALKLLEQLTVTRTGLATLINTQPKDREAWKKQVAELGLHADDLEKELVKRSSALQEEKKLAIVTWHDVQKALKPGEAAVEIVAFPFHDGRKRTARTYYVALVLKPDGKLPKLIVLDDGTTAAAKNASESAQSRADIAMEDYRNLEDPEVEDSQAGRTFYATFWKPLEPALAKAKTIYFAPDGILNQVSLSIVPAEQGKLLLQQYDLRIVTNTKDLLRQSHLTPEKTATLIGNPRFLLSNETQMSAIAAFRSPTAIPVGAEPVLMAALTPNPLSGMLSRDVPSRSGSCPERPAGGYLCPLPNTSTEVAAIGGLLGEKSWTVATYRDAQALEEVVKSVRHPRVLHLATHGFFLSDQQVKQPSTRGVAQPSTGREDPMLRSGLLLAGADRVLKGGASLSDADDGVLTAYEASSLDLTGTELVVLSACETGLGETRAGEGVFGLRRAFEVAGAQSVLMSMWKVPDRETEELMAAFYTKWLGGMEKHRALREAQMELRRQIIARDGHDVPYYWGAWVLVGR